jgi:hypothetical protein
MDGENQASIGIRATHRQQTKTTKKKITKIAAKHGVSKYFCLS